MKRSIEKRRKGALERLKAQDNKGIGGKDGKTPLTEGSKKRVKREIDILETKLH